MSNIINEIDLLNNIIDFMEMTPDENLWSEKKLKSNPPRLIRFQRIKALLKAYLGEDIGISEFINGDFIMVEPHDKYNEFRNYVMKYNKTNNYVYGSEHEFYPGDVSIVFKSFFNYKQKLNAVLSHNSGYIIASGKLLQHSIHVVSKINKSIRKELDDLDHGLKLIINPSNLAFTANELIEKYGYPKDDLSEIDFEWL